MRSQEVSSCGKVDLAPFIEKGLTFLIHVHG